MNTPLSIDKAMTQRLDTIAKSRSLVDLEAIKQYIRNQEWFILSVEEGVAAAEAVGPFLHHADVVAQVEAHPRDRTTIRRITKAN